MADSELARRSQCSFAEDVQCVMELVDRLGELAKTPQGPATARKMFELTNLRIFLRFAPKQQGKRTVNCLHSWEVTFGDAPSPVTLYEGRTSTKAVTAATAPTAERPSTSDSHSLRNANRGNEVPFELYRLPSFTLVQSRF